MTRKDLSMLANKIAKHNVRVLRNEVEDLNKKIYQEINRIVFENGGVIGSIENSPQVYTTMLLSSGAALILITRVETFEGGWCFHGINGDKEECVYTHDINVMFNVLEFIEECL